MLKKKAYELLEFKVIQWNDEDVLTTSGYDIFIEDDTDWSTVK